MPTSEETEAMGERQVELLKRAWASYFGAEAEWAAIPADFVAGFRAAYDAARSGEAEGERGYVPTTAERALVGQLRTDVEVEREGRHCAEDLLLAAVTSLRSIASAEPKSDQARWMVEEAKRGIPKGAALAKYPERGRPDDELEAALDADNPDPEPRQDQPVDRASGEWITHGRHCICSACAAQDWAEPQLAPCGMHGPSCPPVYAPLGAPGDLAEHPETGEREAWAAKLDAEIEAGKTLELTRHEVEAFLAAGNLSYRGVTLLIAEGPAEPLQDGGERRCSKSSICVLGDSAVPPRADILHLADPGPAREGDLVHLTFCGRLTQEVVYWATPELERATDFLKHVERCKVCAFSKRAKP